MKVLIVDDERIERDGIRFLLEKHFDVEISEAWNGKVALHALRQEATDVLMTDIKMPFMDGMELIREARKLYPHLEIIVFSAYGEFDYARQAMKYGVYSYLLKPVVVEEFCETFTQALAHVAQHADQSRLLQEASRQSETWDVLAQSRQTIEALLEPSNESKLASLCGAWGEPGCVCTLLVVNRHATMAGRFAEIRKCAEKCFPDSLLTTLAEENCAFLFLKANPSQEDRQERLLRGVKRFHEALAAIRDGRTYLIYGAPVTGIKQAANQFRQLHALSDFDFFQSGERLLPLEGFAARSQKVRIQNLYQVLENTDFLKMESVKRLVEGIFIASVDGSLISEIELKHLCIEVIRRIGLARKLPDEETQYASLRIMDANEFQDLQTRFTDIVSRFYEAQKEEPNRSCVRTILALIEREYPTNLNLEYISGKVYMSPNYVSALFKQEMGVGLVKYLTNFRLSKACELLLTSNLKVNEIAQAIGYPNVSYFCMLFSNEYGISPAKYRDSGGAQ